MDDQPPLPDPQESLPHLTQSEGLTVRAACLGCLLAVLLVILFLTLFAGRIMGGLQRIGS